MSRRSSSTRSSIAELQKRMTSGQESARSITEKYLARIAALDKQGPSLHAVIETNPEASQIAERSTPNGRPARCAARCTGSRPAQGQHRHRGSDDDDGGLARPRRIDPVARLIRRHAAARGGRDPARQDEPERVGQLPLHAFDQRLERPRRTRRGIPTRSTAIPRDPARDRARPLRPTMPRSRSAPRPTARSCRRRNNCGLVGIKPTLGLVSRTGIIPIAHSQDTAGPMARTVADAAAS